MSRLELVTACCLMLICSVDLLASPQTEGATSARDSAQAQWRGPLRSRRDGTERRPGRFRFGPGRRLANGDRVTDDRTLERQLEEEFEVDPDYDFRQGVDCGILIVNGVPIAGPYVIELSDRSVMINGSAYRCSFAQSNWKRVDPMSIAARIHQELTAKSLVALTDGEPPLFVGRGSSCLLLLQELSNDESDLRAAAFEPWIDARWGMDADAWSEMAAQFQPTEAFRAQVAELELYLEHVATRNLEAIERQSRSAGFAYSLSLFGMVAAILALGQLLTFRPDGDDRWTDVDESAKSQLMTRRCVTMIVLLSGLDLFWTISAWQAGQMRELNPIGQHLVEDPALLIGFKATATLIGCIILLTLKRYRGAQLASWWLCLVLTVLTFRWLTFNSMFMS